MLLPFFMGQEHYFCFSENLEMEMSTSSSKSKVVKIIKWIPAFFILCCSWYLSSQETIEQMPGFWNADKLVHFICFGGFAFWVAFACNIKTAKKMVASCCYNFALWHHRWISPKLYAWTGNKRSWLALRYDWCCNGNFCLSFCLSYNHRIQKAERFWQPVMPW